MDCNIELLKETVESIIKSDYALSLDGTLSDEYRGQLKAEGTALTLVVEMIKDSNFLDTMAKIYKVVL